MQPGQERRKNKRRPILDTFSLFMAIPKKGGHRLPIHDISEAGLGFDLDIDGESADEFPLKAKETLDVQLYLNQSLYVDLQVRVARIEEANGVRRIGSEFTTRTTDGYKAFAAFLQMLDILGESANIRSA